MRLGTRDAWKRSGYCIEEPVLIADGTWEKAMKPVGQRYRKLQSLEALYVHALSSFPASWLPGFF